MARVIVLKRPDHLDLFERVIEGYAYCYSTKPSFFGGKED